MTYREEIEHIAITHNRVCDIFMIDHQCHVDTTQTY